MKKPAVRLWLVAALLIAAGVVGRVVLHTAADGPGYGVIIQLQMGFYGLGLLVLGLWVLAEHRRSPTHWAVVVWLTAAVLCAMLTCASSPH